MKGLLIWVTLFSCFITVAAQKAENENKHAESLEIITNKIPVKETNQAGLREKTYSAGTVSEANKINTDPYLIENKENTGGGTVWQKDSNTPIGNDFSNAEKNNLEKIGELHSKNAYSGDIPDTPIEGKQKFHWKPAIMQSLLFLGVQHAFRMTEEKTRSEVGGPFFRDWKESVQNLRGWDDGGKFFTNYVAHPMQGGATSRIFINNSERASSAEFGKSKKYWTSRLKSMAWTAVWSTLFEIGPISEASFGNVGQKLDTTTGRSKMTWQDIVLTPTLGTIWVVAEDVVDKYILKNWIERKTKNAVVRGIFRTILTPSTSFANLMRLSKPWRRDNRID